MENEERIVRHRAAEIDAMRARGEDRTDWARLEAMTDEEIEASIDHEDEGEFDWENVIVGLPSFKRQLTLRLDADIIDWFKAQGAGSQTRMNAVLRSDVDAKRAGSRTAPEPS